MIPLFSSPIVFAEVVYPVQHQSERFEQRLVRIQSAVDRVANLPTTEEKIRTLDGSGAREALTELQNLFRIYKEGKRFEALEPFYEKTKKFEDLISHMRDLRWFASQAENSGNKEASARYVELLREKNSEYDAFIQNSEWFAKNPSESMLTKIRTALSQIDWPTLESDRDYLLKRLAKRMSKIQAKDYDMNLVELGIHELKRDARRLFYLDRSIGLLQQDYNRACPLGQDPIEEIRKPIVKFQCQISACLTSKLQDAQYKLDSIKMDGLAYELRGEHVPASVIDSAKVVYNDLKGSNVLLHLEAQINGCRSEKSQDADQKEVEEENQVNHDFADKKIALNENPEPVPEKFIGVSTKTKFMDFVNKIEVEVLAYGGNPEKIDALAKGSLRQALFSIQTLADLYTAQYQELKEVWTTSKRFEDAIGKYRQSIEQYDYAVNKGASPEKIAQLEKSKELQKATLISFLDSAKWSSGQTVARLKEILSQIEWKSDAADQYYTYSALASKMRKVDETNWNMEVLEGGGIHDLRKAVRWYRLEMTALGDLITFQNQSCSQPSPPISAGKCLISECHNSQMSKINTLFGEIKDIGEGQHGVGGEIPQELMDQAAALYAETRSQQTFTLLTKEFNSCAEAAIANEKK